MKKAFALIFCFAILVESSSQEKLIPSIIDFSASGGIRLEDGVSAEVFEGNGALFLKISTRSNEKKTPTAYLATVDVAPGQSYTYFTIGHTGSATRALHLVGADSENIVWPGGEILEGPARTYFRVPEGVTKISLAVSFLYPETTSAIYISDIALFEGNIESWQGSGGETLEPILKKRKDWVVWLLLISFLVLIAILYMTSRRLAPNYNSGAHC